MRHSELLCTLQNLTNRKITQREIADFLGCPTNTISNRAARNSDYSLEEVLFICEKLNLSLNKVWKGNEINISNEIISNSDSDFQANYFPEVFGSCGGGAFVLSETKELINIPKVAVKAYNSIKSYSVINAYGDSMLPYIQDKDLLVVEHYDNGEQIRDNRIYVFCYNEQIFVKRLVKNVNELVIISDNPDKEIYKTIRLVKEEMNDIILIGEIVGLIRKFD